MSKLTKLLKAYETHIAVPWQEGLAGTQRVIFAVYEPSDELRLRAHVAEFEIATRNAGHEWQLLDITNTFPQWMSQVRYKDSYFESPADLDGYGIGQISGFTKDLQAKLQDAVSEYAMANTVTALLGVGTLFGLTRVSKIVEAIAPEVKGRLLVFFPGIYINNNYRLLDARDGWNYMAVPLTA